MNYLDSIIDALSNLNGESHIKNICNYIQEHNTLDYVNTNPNWKEQISNSITTHSSDSHSYRGGENLFYTPLYGSGIWGLRYQTVCPEELTEENMDGIVEGAKKQIIVNSYERNPYARKRCIDHYKSLHNGKLQCEICGFDFGQVYGDNFAEKIHVHHLVEISSIGEEYEVDAINDLLPICPNCHLIAHSKKPAYSPDEIRQMIGRNKNG